MACVAAFGKHAGVSGGGFQWRTGDLSAFTKGTVGQFFYGQAIGIGDGVNAV